MDHFCGGHRSANEANRHLAQAARGAVTCARKPLQGRRNVSRIPRVTSQRPAAARLPCWVAVTVIVAVRHVYVCGRRSQKLITLDEQLTRCVETGMWSSVRLYA